MLQIQVIQCHVEQFRYSLSANYLDQKILSLKNDPY